MIAERFDKNPILAPDAKQSWEAEAVFNGCPAKKNGKIFLLYRAVSAPHYHTLAETRLPVSDIGIAESKDGLNFSKRSKFIVPERNWERFGCEDPRITKLGNKYYTFYTALSAYPFRADGIRIGLAVSKDLKTISEKHLVTPFNAKAMALFPEKINGKWWTILTVNTDKPPASICLASFDREEDLWSEALWQKWYGNFEKNSLPLRRTDRDQIEVGSPPLKTKDGWLLFYSYIQNYFSPHPLFRVEAVLLDLKNPTKIVARTDNPLLTPETYYEKTGRVQNIVFPSGAIAEKKRILLYYGSADTTCSVAFVSLPALMKSFDRAKESSQSLWMNEQNIISPNSKNSWEAKATFNPGVVHLKNKIHLLYRAMGPDNTSVLGYARSNDGLRIDYRSKNPAYVPREPFESKLQPGGNSGAEDPRLTKIGNRIYMCYTAYDGRNPPRVAMTSIAEEDFLKENWNWKKSVIISPPGIDDKDACLFPEKIDGNYLIIHRSDNDIDVSFNKDLDFDGTRWIEEERWIAPRPGMWDSMKVGIASPPLKTKKGWLILYHGVSENGTYRVGAVLSDLKNPLHVIARTDEPIFEPRTEYEKSGEVSNVVFPCGAVVVGKNLFMYYGGADKVVGVAVIPLQKILSILESYRY